jgi:desulfoferrodoxin (superoxide reductase-like protein)
MIVMSQYTYAMLYAAAILAVELIALIIRKCSRIRLGASLLWGCVPLVALALLLQPLAAALGVSLIELMNGVTVANRNVSANLLRSKFYVCPLCGNVIHCGGESVVSCCGLTLPPLEAEEADEEHPLRIEEVEDEHFVTVDHPMTKQHYISFVAYMTTDRMQLVKLYPEGNAQTRLQLRGRGVMYFYCNRHGLFKRKI